MLKKIRVRQKLLICLNLSWFILLLPLITWGRGYYFSSSTGSDSYSSTQAQNQATPWKTISKLNSFFSSLQPGDTVYFKRGEVFYGSIVATRSGTAALPIVFAAYGTKGSRPVLSGLTSVSGWTSLGNGIYESTVLPVKTSMNLVVLDGVPVSMGRYPNNSNPDSAYLTYESFATAGGSITDNELTSTINWTGAEVVIRKNRWIMDRGKITAHSGTTLTYTNPTSYAGLAGFGYFIQNDARTLDRYSEWFLNSNTKKLQLYFGTELPASHTITVSSIDTLIQLGANKYFTITELALEGANVAAVYALNGGNVTMTNCDLRWMGKDGIYLDNCPSVMVDNVTTNYVQNNAIDIRNEAASSAAVRNCSIKNTGLWPGMGSSGDATYRGLAMEVSSGGLAEYNKIDSTGYVALQFQGNNVDIRYNFINNFCMVKDDGGGIYTWTNNGAATYTSRRIYNNIILNAKGVPYGTQGKTAEAKGIYLDGGAMNVDVYNNSVAYSARTGLLYNNAVNVKTYNNVIFDARFGVELVRFAGAPLVRNITLKKNVIYPKTTVQANIQYKNFELNNPTATTIQADMQAIGVLDSNYYATPNPSGFSCFYSLTNGGALVYPAPFSLEGWQEFMAQERASKRPYRTAADYVLNRTLTSNTVTNGDLNTGISGITFWAANTNYTATWDNTSKISGVGSLKITPLSSSTVWTSFYAPVGAIAAGKKYVLRFTTLGTLTNGNARATLRKTSSPFSNLAAYQSRTFGTLIKQHEIYFDSPTADANASYIIEIQQSSGTVYVDNIEFYEVDATTLNVDDQVRFEYNANNSAQTIQLGADYFDVDGTRYAGSVTLQPFTSKVLIKDTARTAALYAASSATAIACNGGSATITVTASGGAAPYTGTGTFVVRPGTYSYTVRDAVGQSATTSITVTEPDVLAVTISYSPITVIGGTTRLIVAATGGTAPYTGTGTFTVSAGNYSYTITDANGCSVTKTGVITQPIQTAASSTRINCFGGTSVVTVSALGGIPPYNGTGNFTVAAGTYTYVVEDAAGQSASTTISVTQPAAPLSVLISAPPITVAGGSTTVTVSASGGTAPYTGTGTFSNISAGNYSYSVSDAQGCTATSTISITAPNSFLATLSGAGVRCFGQSGTVTIAASGGVSPYSGTGTMTVSSGKGSLKVAANNPVSGTNTLLYWTIGGISSSKSYVLRFTTVGTTASGSLKCALRQTTTPFSNITASQTRTFGTARQQHEIIFNNPTTTANASFLIEVAQASGVVYIDNIGVFEATAAGVLQSANLYVNGDFESNISNLYSWSPNANHVLSWDTTGLIPRIYYFPVKDAQGLVSVASYEAVQPAAPLLATATTPNVLIYGGTTSVTVNATGGTSPYTGTGTFDGIRAGTYSYSVTDANGCQSAASISVTEPAELFVKPNATRINCYGGTATVSFIISGGVAPYSGAGPFTVAAGNYTYTITDANGATFSTAITVPQPDPLVVSATAAPITVPGGTTTVTVAATGGTVPYTGTGTFTVTAGTYSYTVRDSSGCTASKSITIAPALQVTVAGNPVSCFGGTSSVTVSAQGGVSPYTGTGTFTVNAGTYTYTVRDAAGTTTTSSITITQPSAALSVNATAPAITVAGGSTTVTVSATGGTAPYTGTGSFSNIVAGTYTYTVTDAKGCTASKTITIAPVLLATATGNAVPCFGGTTSVTVAATGGTAPYTGTGTFTVSAGTYNYTVTDAAGLSASASITISQPAAALAVQATAQAITVAGGSTTVTVSATGGTAPYTGTGTFTNVLAGTYTYTVTDAKGCTASATINVPAFTGLSITTGNTQVNCYNGTTTATISATGGTAPYTGTGSYVLGAGKGSLKLSVTNPDLTRYILSYWTIGAVSSTKNYVLKFSTLGTSTNGSLRVALRQTNSPFSNITASQSGTFGTTRKEHTFYFSAPPTTSAASFLIEIAQGSGTTYLDNIAFFEAATDSTLVGANLYSTGTFETGISSIYTWTLGNIHTATWDTTRKISNTYYYLVNDAAGNTATVPLSITQPAAPLVASVSGNPVSATGGTTVLTVTATGGTAPYTGTGTYTVPVGIYTYTVTDARGCKSTTSIKVTKAAIKADTTATTGRAAITLTDPLTVSDNLVLTAFPNPTNNLFNLQIRSNSQEPVTIELIGFDGRKLQQFKGAADKTYQLGNNLMSGVYTALVRQGNRQQSIRLVKAR